MVLLIFKDGQEGSEEAHHSFNLCMRNSLVNVGMYYDFFYLFIYNYYTFASRNNKQKLLVLI